MERRDVLRLLGGIGVVALAGCATSSKRGARTTTTSAPVDASGPSTAAIPEETAGPFPGDGSNGPDVLTQRGVVRRDITKSFGSASGTAEGVPTTLQLTVLAAGTGKPLTDAAVYVWHCDREGRYSLYSDGATDQNYLRGVQVADAEGTVRFTSIFPACYAGRWPHIHFEVYPDQSGITDAGTTIATSQVALPKETC